jgi:SAM-dependent methyltransferase
MIARFRRAARRLLQPGLRLGAVALTRPISSEFGFDRGLPVDRYYIETFLREHAADVRGRTLEVGDDAYSRRFGGDRAHRRETVHIDPAEPATFHGDITQPGILPEGVFDCIVFTQTLHLIYDMATAIDRLHAALKPGGVLLITVPGISPIAGDRWGENWFWSLTPASLRRLCDDRFGALQALIGCHGNVLSATAFLYGLATHELSAAQLDAFDPRYPVVVTARVQRPIAHEAS